VCFFVMSGGKGSRFTISNRMNSNKQKIAYKSSYS
jgi:hypothetical protein